MLVISLGDMKTNVRARDDKVRFLSSIVDIPAERRGFTFSFLHSSTIQRINNAYALKLCWE
jgi:hypothetical protein